MKAFALSELVVSIIILGIISIASSQIILQLQKQESLSFSLAQTTLRLENSLLQIEHYLQDAQQISFKHSKLSWKNENQSPQSLELRNHDLLLNQKILLGSVDDFNAQNINSNWLIRICSAKICLQRGILIYGY